MKVILLSDVKKQGKKDDVIDVSDGYANNYLIKNKLAVPYSKKSKEVLDKSIEKRNNDEEKRREEAIKLGKEISKKKYVFYLKSGNSGKTFGSISTKQIADELKSSGFNIDKKNIYLESTLDTIGEHIIEIELHKNVRIKITISIKEK